MSPSVLASQLLYNNTCPSLSSDSFKLSGLAKQLQKYDAEQVASI